MVLLGYSTHNNRDVSTSTTPCLSPIVRGTVFQSFVSQFQIQVEVDRGLGDNTKFLSGNLFYPVFTHLTEKDYLKLYIDLFRSLYMFDPHPSVKTFPVS